MSRATLRVMLVVGVGLFAIASSVEGQQDCGTICEPCAISADEGKNYSPSGEHHMTCLVTETSNCHTCGVGAVGAGQVSAATIAAVMDGVPAAAVATAMEAYGDRIVLNPERNLLLVLGTGCNDHGIARIVFVSTEKARAFREYGAQPVSDFLRTLELMEADPGLRGT